MDQRKLAEAQSSQDWDDGRSKKTTENLCKIMSSLSIEGVCLPLAIWVHNFEVLNPHLLFNDHRGEGNNVAFFYICTWTGGCSFSVWYGLCYCDSWHCWFLLCVLHRATLNLFINHGVECTLMYQDTMSIVCHDLHWPFGFQVDFQVLALIYKALHGLKSAYIRKHICLVCCCHRLKSVGHLTWAFLD